MLFGEVMLSMRKASGAVDAPRRPRRRENCRRGRLILVVMKRENGSLDRIGVATAFGCWGRFRTSTRYWKDSHHSRSYRSEGKEETGPKKKENEGCHNQEENISICGSVLSSAVVNQLSVETISKQVDKNIKFCGTYRQNLMIAAHPLHARRAGVAL